MIIKPKAIKADRTVRTITITWQDEQTSTFSFDGLRLACPCVECKGGHAHMGKITPPEDVRDAAVTDITLTALQAVGSYAIQPMWSDGHNTGIYSFKLLRALSGL